MQPHKNMNKKEPKYMTIVDWIQERIERGEFEPGSRLYSENELSEKFNLSRQTVRHAIDVLEQRRLVTRIQGSGTFVSGLKENRETREKTMNIAVISTYVDSYIFPNIIKGIEKILSLKGYMVQIAFTNNRIDRERMIIQNILDKNNIDGLIVEATKSALPNPNIPFYQEVLNRNIPILFFNSYYPALKAPHISLNDKKMAAKATDYLIRCGHKKIAAIFKADDGQGHLRYAGYSEAMLRAGLMINDTNIFWMDTEDVKNFRLEGNRVLSRIGDCSAVFCYNDEIAFHLMEICEQEKIAVPEKLSIISIDNSNLAILSDVLITSIPHPMEGLGKKVAENLLAMIDDPDFDGNYEFETEIIIRDSVRQIGGEMQC